MSFFCGVYYEEITTENDLISRTLPPCRAFVARPGEPVYGTMHDRVNVIVGHVIPRREHVRARMRGEKDNEQET